jgi:hypothetical protein
VSVGTFIGSPSIAYPLERIELRSSHLQYVCQEENTCKWLKVTAFQFGLEFSNAGPAPSPRALTGFGHSAGALGGLVPLRRKSSPGLNNRLGGKLVYGGDGDLIAELTKGSRQHLGALLLFPRTYFAACSMNRTPSCKIFQTTRQSRWATAQMATGACAAWFSTRRRYLLPFAERLLWFCSALSSLPGQVPTHDVNSAAEEKVSQPIGITGITGYRVPASFRTDKTD